LSIYLYDIKFITSYIIYKEGFKGFVGERLLKYHLEKSNIQIQYNDFINSIIIK